MSEPTTIALLAFDGVDLLDLGGPYEVFLTANRLALRDHRKKPPFDVVTMSADGGTRETYGGMRIEPQASVSDIGEVGVFLVPGLVDYKSGMEDEELVGAISVAGRRARITASVCTGAFLLSAAGLLGDVTATTHFEDVPELGARIGQDNVVRARWVDAGRVVTSGGLSNGIDMALHLVHRLDSLDLAERTARQIEYRWDPANGVIPAAPA